jgi:hypothetical protein
MRRGYVTRFTALNSYVDDRECIRQAGTKKEKPDTKVIQRMKSSKRLSPKQHKKTVCKKLNDIDWDIQDENPYALTSPWWNQS